MESTNFDIAPEGLTYEETLREWWQQRFASALPEDVKKWLRALIRNEVSRARSEAQRMDDITLQRVREGRRLQQTKLNNLEASLQRIRLQQDGMRRYVELSTELEQQRKKLYEANKRQASVLTQQRELERFEIFEPINGRFQRIVTLTHSVELARQEISRLALKIEEARKRETESGKALEAERINTREALAAVLQAAETMSEAERLEQQEKAQRERKAEADGICSELNDRLQRTQQALQDVRSEHERVRSELSALKLQRQSLEAHHHMISRSEAIQVMLDELQEAILLRDRLSRELNQAIIRQNERDEQLGHIFTQHQKLTADIRARQDELDGHRKSTAGQDSFNLQRRALELRSRKLRLETGLSLWRNIAAGFDLMEQKDQQISTMRLRAEHLSRSVDQLQTEVGKLSAQLKQKTYHWTLSKSQNVIELRSDLSEGYPCTVCGATHHPWRSEDVSQQNALISSLKADCEAMELDLNAKRQQLEENQLELNAIQAKLETENANYQILQRRQQQDTEEWQNFAPLDRSLIECSRTTNREARTALIRQLIEKTAFDAEDAEKELNTFSFHMDAIARIGEDIRRLQQQSAELTVRLNEVNTACQVMAGQVERLNQRLSAATQNYSQRYAALEQVISLPEWFQEWSNSPESLKMKLQDMTELWKKLRKEIQRLEVGDATCAVQETLLTQTITLLQTDILNTESRSEKAGELASKAEDSLHKLLPDTDGRALFLGARLQLQQQAEQQEARQAEHDSCKQECTALAAQQQERETLLAQDGERVAAERKELDLWMRQYNANNPPVQFAELERVLADGNDWNEVRANVRSTSIEAAITQARVDYLTAQIIALQAEGIRPNIMNIGQEQEELSRQQTALEQQRREILRSIAQMDEQLRTHEQTLCQPAKD